MRDRIKNNSTMIILQFLSFVFMYSIYYVYLFIKFLITKVQFLVISLTTQGPRCLSSLRWEPGSH